MGENTAIPWCDHTFNGWIGCSPVSPACDNCYAAALVKRWGGSFSTRRRTSPANWKKPLKWNRHANTVGPKTRVFCGSLCDWCDGVIPTAWRIDLYRLARDTPALTWLMLTKRPKNIITSLVSANMWLGITGETMAAYCSRRRYLGHKIDKIMRGAYDAPTTFVSCEPMLERMDPIVLSTVDMVILGCEKINGRPGRPTQLDWVKEICEERQGATFVKQLDVGAGKVSTNPEEWPEWARRQEFPDDA